MKQFTSPHQKIGLYGEKEAELFLVKHGYAIIERNFSSKSGEIDLICAKNNKYYFIEVKAVTVSHVTINTENIVAQTNVSRGTLVNEVNEPVSRETNVINSYLAVSPASRQGGRETFLKENRKLVNPFQNVSYTKVRKLIKTIEQYISLKAISRETPWQCDGIGVYLNSDMSLSKVEYIEHITIR